MNELCIVKTLQKRSIRVAVFSVILVGIMMVFVVPTLIEEAQARTIGTAVSQAGPFSDVTGRMDFGRYVISPVHIGPVILWMSEGVIGTSEREEGTIIAKVGEGSAVISWKNPPAREGNNTCQAAVNDPGLQAACHIDPRGHYASATFSVTKKTQ